MQSGVYTITNTASGKRYVGSATNFAARWRVHQSLLRNGKHHSTHLQSAWQKHGAEAFVFAPILICAPDNCVMYEQIIIDACRAAERDYGYNAAPQAGMQRGVKHSDESRAKIRAARAKQVFSAETRALLSKLRTGSKMPAWFGPSVSARRIGVKHTDEARAKMSAAKQANPRRGQGRHPMKLTLELAEQIRREVSAGEMQVVVSKKYDVSIATVSQIINGKVWKRAKGDK